MNSNSREAILIAATRAAQSHGYSGLNFREIAKTVGIKSASIYYHFESKADLGAAVAKRYWENTKAELEKKLVDSPDLLRSLREYPNIFRRSLESDNRICLGSFMGAEFDDLPDPVKKEVQTFADVNIAWLSQVLSAAHLVCPEGTERRARAIFAAVAGAQLIARSRSNLPLYDELIDSYRLSGLLP